MADSYRDKRAHKARNPKKYISEEDLLYRGYNVDWLEILFREGIYPTKNTPKITWSIQGKRRRNTSRKSNQKTKQMIHQIERAKSKVDFKRQIKDIEV